MNASSVLLATSATGVRLLIHVIPRAPRSRIDGVRDGRLLVRVTAPPVDRAANEAVIALLADALGLAKRSIRIASGERSRHKAIDLEGLSVEELRRRLSDILA